MTMSKYYVPIYVTIESPTHSHAIAAKQAIEKLIAHGMVEMALRTSNVPFESAIVTDPIPVQDQTGAYRTG